MKKTKKFIKILGVFALTAACALTTFSGCIVGADGKDGVAYDGKDGEDLTLNSVYETYLELTGKTKDEYSLLDFIEDRYGGYSNSELNELTSLENTMNRSLLSGIALYTTFDFTTSVSIYTGFRPSTKQIKYSNTEIGSGVIVDMDDTTQTAYVVTNCHMVYNYSADQPITTDIHMFLYGQDVEGVNFTETTDLTLYNTYGIAATTITDDEKYVISGEVVGASLAYDIGLIKVTGSDYNRLSLYGAQAAEWCTDEEVYLGETVYTVGNPMGEGISITKGVISRDSEDFYADITGTGNYYRTYRVLRTDAAINGGNSGGGLFNKEGKLVGIVNGKTGSSSSSSSIDNMGYALPANSIRRVIALLKANEDGAITSPALNRVYLGVATEVTSSTTSYVETNGVGRVQIKQTIAITTVSSNSLAEGTLQVGDEIRTVCVNNGTVHTVTRQYQLTNYILEAQKVGDTITVGITRDGTEMEFTFTVRSSDFANADD
jgi:S1-C subfamily serine protease